MYVFYLSILFYTTTDISKVYHIQIKSSGVVQYLWRIRRLVYILHTARSRETYEVFSLYKYMYNDTVV